MNMTTKEYYSDPNPYTEKTSKEPLPYTGIEWVHPYYMTSAPPVGIKSWQQKYYELLEKYTALLEKHQEV